MLLKGDCIKVMKAMKPNSVDAIDHICPVCKKEFKKKVYKKVQAVYCSQECAYKGRTLGYTKRHIIKPYKIVNSLKRRIQKTCEICGQEFESIPSRKDTNKYCSRKCFEISHEERMRGENNPSYINGNSYNKRSWRGHDWEEIRKAVYERDDFTCQNCGIKCIGRKELNKNNSHRLIQGHHIERYKTNQSNDLNKLTTLCASCHGKAEAQLCC